MRCARVPSSVPTSSAARCAPTRPRRAMAAGVAPGGLRRRRSSCRWPTAARERSTRCSPRAAVRVARRGSPDRSAIRSTREWGVLPGGIAIVEMAQASGLALVRGRNDPLRASTRGTGELIAAVRAQGFNRVVVAVGGSATTDGGLAAVEALGWSLAGHEGHGRVRRRDRRSSTPRTSTVRRRARRDAQVALLDAPARRRSPTSTARAPASTSRSSTGAGAAGGLAGGLAAIGAELAPGLRRRRRGGRARSRVRRRRPRGDRRRQARRVEPRGQGRRRRARVGRRPRRRATSRSSPVRSTDDARAALAERARRAGARADRSRVAVERGVHARRAARRGSRYRGGDEPRSVRRHRDRSAGARAPRPAAPSIVPSGAARSSSTNGAVCFGEQPGAPQRGRHDRERLRRRARRAGGCGARARRGRPARPRRARSARRRRRATRARRPNPRRTAALRARSRRAAYSPPSGCTMSASFGNSSDSSGRATSSVTRPPPVGAPSNERAVVAPSRTWCRARRAAARSSRSTYSPRKLRRSASTQQMMSPVARVQRLPHRVALARSRPGLGEHRRLGRPPGRRPRRRPRRCRRSSRRRARRPRRRGRGATASRDDGADRSPPRCAPAGTRRPGGRLQPWTQARAGVRTSGALAGAVEGAMRGAILSGQRAHRERPRDRPFDAAATSEDRRARARRCEPGANA